LVGLWTETLCSHRQIPSDADADGACARAVGRTPGIRERIFRSSSLDGRRGAIRGCDARPLDLSWHVRFFQDTLRRPTLDFQTDDRLVLAALRWFGLPPIVREGAE